MTKVGYRLDDLDGVQEAALGQVALARKALRRGRSHDLRKAAKRLRALLRLIRDDVGAKQSKKDDRLIRDIARAAGPARDAEVIAALFDVLAPRLDTPISDIDAVRARLRKRIAKSEERLDATAIAKSLDRVERRIRRWKATPSGVNDGLDRTLRRCRRRMHAAEGSSDAEALHDWRKEAKYHWHHCELVDDQPRAKQAHALSETLGDDHDLVVLLAQSGGLEGLENIVASRREALQERAFELGHDLLEVTN